MLNPIIALMLMETSSTTTHHRETTTRTQDKRVTLTRIPHLAQSIPTDKQKMRCQFALMPLESDSTEEDEVNETLIRCGIELEEERLGRKLNQTEVQLVINTNNSLKIHI